MNNNIPTNKVLVVYPELMFNLYDYNINNIHYRCNRDEGPEIHWERLSWV